jgi:DNA-binding NtrC family response regulator
MPSDTPPKVRATVLVVDDDPQMRAVLRDFLEREGHRVIEQSSGEQAIDVIESEPLDVVILDKEMPGMNGLDLIAYLQHRVPAVPIIFITAFGGARIAEEAQRRGAWCYLEKPFRVARVLEAIEQVTATRR